MDKIYAPNIDCEPESPLKGPILTGFLQKLRNKIL